MEYMQQTLIAIPAWGECSCYQLVHNGHHSEADSQTLPIVHIANPLRKILPASPEDLSASSTAELDLLPTLRTGIEWHPK